MIIDDGKDGYELEVAYEIGSTDQEELKKSPHRGRFRLFAKKVAESHRRVCVDVSGYNLERAKTLLEFLKMMREVSETYSPISI